jgi:hypothetical protein
MKMDARQKQKIRRVAKIHFALSVFFGVMFLILAPSLATAKSHSEPNLIWVIFVAFWAISFFLLQPQCFLIPVLVSAFPIKNPFVEWAIFFILPLIIAPFWSYTFASIFIRVHDRLNHFPVLGKKVF